MLWAELNLPVHLPTENNAQCGERRETASPPLPSNIIAFVANRQNPGRRTLKRQLIVLGVLVVCCLASYGAINRWFLSTVVVQGRSMAPTLRDGDRCLLNRLSYLCFSPKRGDLVVLRDRADNDLAVKRIVALPGESVRVSEGRMFVNGRRLVEPYLENGTETIAPAGADPSHRLGADEYFVLGDNRAESEDSRFYGPVARDQIVGTLIR